MQVQLRSFFIFVTICYVNSRNTQFYVLQPSVDYLYYEHLHFREEIVRELIHDVRTLKKSPVKRMPVLMTKDLVKERSNRYTHRLNVCNICLTHITRDLMVYIFVVFTNNELFILQSLLSFPFHESVPLSEYFSFHGGMMQVIFDVPDELVFKLIVTWMFLHTFN